MKTITATARIEDGKILIEAPAPADLAEGAHEVTIQVEEVTTQPRQQRSILDELEPINNTAWPVDSTYSREDIYDDDGR